MARRSSTPGSLKAATGARASRLHRRRRRSGHISKAAFSQSDHPSHLNKRKIELLLVNCFVAVDIDNTEVIFDQFEDLALAALECVCNFRMNT